MTDRQPAPDPSFPPPEAPEGALFVVGIGWSAGGLEALEQLVAGIPDQTDLAYVIGRPEVDETGPELARRLGTRTALPVRETVDGAPVQGGHIYLPPAQATVRIEGESFRLAAPTSDLSTGPTLDAFLTTLAESLGPNSAGVVLSGSDTDGARGLRAIRAAGGITVAQDPESAKFDRMPSAALAEGSVDLLLAPESLAGELERLIERVRRGPTPSENEQDAVDQILSNVKTHTGLDFAAYKRTSLTRRLRRRLALNRCSNLERYATFTREHPEELDLLARDILVSVTSFFRDERAFRALREAVDRLVANKRESEPIRVWVPACATGEEAYSIAIVFAESLGGAFERSGLVVYGTDVDAEAIEYARRGAYGSASLERVDSALVARWFDRDQSLFIVKKALRERMVFAPQDLVNDPPFSQLDLVACRNLLIYLRSTAQTDTLRLFHYALRSGGLLFLGRSESVGSLDHLFGPVAKPHRIYRRLEGPPEPYHGQRGRTLPIRTAEAIARHPQRRASRRDAVAHALADLFGAPAVLIDERRELLYVRGDVTDYFNLREGDAALSIIDLASTSLRPALRSGIHRAARDRKPMVKRRVRVEVRGRERLVDLHILPASRITGQDGTQLVVIRKTPSSDPGDSTPTEHVGNDDARIRELESELAATQDNLQDAIDELETTNAELSSLNQELHSANEELQSANEELETANEEYQATNEELTTVNEELRAKTRELRGAYAEIENILSCITTPLVVVDRELRILEFSRPATDVLGLFDNAIGMKLGAVAENDLLRHFIPDVEAVAGGGEPRRREVDVDGRLFVGETRPFVEPAGQLAGALLLLHDLTESRQREREFATLADNAPDVVARFDRSCRHLYVNRVLEQYTGRPRQEWVGRSNRELGLPAEVCEPIEATVRRVFESAQSASTDFTFTSPSGARHFQGRFVPELDSRGRVQSVMSVSRDITEQVESQTALANAKARIEDLLESISDGFFSLDDHLTVTYFNDAAGRLLGRERASVSGRHLFDAFPEAAGSLFEYRYRKALRDRSPDRFETYFPPYDDWYEVRVYPSNEGISVFFQVITERKRAEEEHVQLEREFHHAQKMQALGTLSGGVAHEFNNLLMAIAGFTEIVLSRTDLPHDATTDLEEVILATQRGRSLVDQILAFGRKSVAAPRPLLLNDPVTRVARILASTLPRRIDVVLRLSDDLKLVQADPGQMEQVLLNLAANAQDAIKGPGTLEIATRNDHRTDGFAPPPDAPEGEYVVLSVRDDGVGMDEETISRVFDPFFTTKRVGSGTGLGLSTVYGIVKSHRGFITCQSHPGHGATFEVHLPVSEDASVAAPSAPPERRSASGAGETVLVVDDEPSLRQFYQRILERRGYRVLLAPSGEKALELFADYRERIQLAIVDLGMPGMGGLECVGQLLEASPRLPIVVATGYASAEDTEAALSAGARSVIRKPFRRGELMRVLRDALDAPKG